MEPLKKPRGAYRKELYAIFQQMLGREMTPEEHDNLKTLMVEYLRDHQMDLAPPPTKIEYTFTCRNCRQQTYGKGKEFRKKMIQKGKSEAVVSPKSENQEAPEENRQGFWDNEYIVP